MIDGPGDTYGLKRYPCCCLCSTMKSEHQCQKNESTPWEKRGDFTLHFFVVDT